MSKINAPEFEQQLNDVKRQIGSLIALHRTANGLTQHQLAEKMGVTTQYISAIETGHDTISLRGICRFVNALGISFEVRFFKNQ